MESEAVSVLLSVSVPAEGERVGGGERVNVLAESVTDQEEVPVLDEVDVGVSVGTIESEGVG